MNPSVPDDDRSLIRQYQNGDYKAYETIYYKYRDWAIKVLSIQGMSPEDASDACQDIFTILIKSLKTFDCKLAFKPYLDTLIHNKYVDYIRKKKKGIGSILVLSQALSSSSNDDTDEQICSFLNMGEDLSEKFELEDIIRHCLKFVKSPRWQSMISLWLRGYKQKGIAEILKMPMGSVGSGLARAKTLFLGCIKQNLSH